MIIFVDALLNSNNLPYMSQSLERKFYKKFLQWDNLLAYLKRRIPEIVIETVIEDTAKMTAAVATLFTFPAAQRELVTSPLLEWEQLNVSATKIQAHYRNYANKKLRLFSPVMPSKDGLEKPVACKIKADFL